MYCFKLPLSFAGRYQASGCASRNESVTMKGKTNRFFSLPLLSYDRLVNSGCPDFALFPRIATPTETSSIHERGTRSVFFFLFGPKNDYPLFFFFFFSTGKNLLQIHKNHNDIFVQGIILLLFKINPMTNPSFSFFFAFFV